MIQAVFFDLYNTLITYRPAREDVHAQALEEFGKKVDRQKIAHGLKAGDEFFYKENTLSRVQNRTAEEQIKIWRGYEEAVLKTAGVKSSPELIDGILSYLKNTDYKMVLFDDVLPALRQIKDNALQTGIISNIDIDIRPMCQEMGLDSLIDIIATSMETGLSKPDPDAFKYAAKKLNIKPSECVYVGDQYQIDVIGANQAGMTGVLVDREGIFNRDKINGYCIKSLEALDSLLDKISHNRE